MRLSDEMRRVLKKIRRAPWSTPKACRCSYRTFMALESRGLIQVGSSFGAIAFPRTAEAVITDDGEAVLNSTR
jgi:hypothetical protein